jgi:hypothetical protein
MHFLSRGGCIQLLTMFATLYDRSNAIKPPAFRALPPAPEHSVSYADSSAKTACVGGALEAQPAHSAASRAAGSRSSATAKVRGDSKQRNHGHIVAVCTHCAVHCESYSVHPVQYVHVSACTPISRSCTKQAKALIRSYIFQVPIFGNKVHSSEAWLSETRLRYKRHADAVRSAPIRPANAQMAGTTLHPNDFMCVTL